MVIYIKSFNKNPDDPAVVGLATGLCARPGTEANAEVGEVALLPGFL